MTRTFRCILTCVLSAGLALPAWAATPREGTWKIQSLRADTDLDVRVQGTTVVMHRSMHEEFEGQAYTLEHLFRGKAGDGRLKFKMLARDDAKAPFEELREVEVELSSPEKMMLDGVPVLFVAPLENASATKAAASSKPGASTPARAWSGGGGYFAQVVRQTRGGEDLFGMYEAISDSKEGEAAFDAGEAAVAKKDWKGAVASFETALEAGVPVSRFAPQLARAYMEPKDCAHAEKMVARARRLDPDGEAPAAMARELKQACPASKLSAQSPRMDRSSATRIIAAVEAQTGAAEKLVRPRSYDDVLEVLKLDQLSLFPGAVAFISGQKDIRAQALLAQIELAWAESLQQLAEIDANLAARFRDLADNADRQGDDAEVSASELRASAADAQQTAEALKLAAADHLSRGLEVARGVIKQAPNDYLGYRVAADYHRLTGDWASFDAMLTKLEKANPNSNGLLFLKGVAASQRAHDNDTAAKLLRAALAKDPRFTRAQVQLMLVQPTREPPWAALMKLTAMSPNHPIVRWTGPALERLRAAGGK